MIKSNYPFNKKVFITENTVKLTPATFSSDGSIWEYRQIEYFYKKVLEKGYDDIVIIDIGAQTGLYTLFAQFVKNAIFYAFEPYSACYEELCENIKLNNINNVNVSNIAISNKSEIKNLKVQNHLGLSTLGDNPIRFLEYKNVEVKCDTIDNLFYDKNIKVDFIKCDTEGWEYYVLLGGLKTIKKYNPVLQLEYNIENMNQCNISPEMFNNLIKSIGYVLTYADGEEHIYEYNKY